MVPCRDNMVTCSHSHEIIFRWVDMQLIPVILCGGVHSHPQSISGEKHTQPQHSPDNYASLQQSILRGALLPGVQKVVAVMSRDAFFPIQETVNHLPLAAQTISFILEPFRRNTSASVAATALHIAQLHGEDALVLIMPSEPLSVDQDVFQKAISAAMDAALSGKLIAFSMRLYQANAIYSWAKADTVLDLRTSFQWNSSLFLFKAGAMLNALGEHCPDVLSKTSVCVKHSNLIEETRYQKLELDPNTFSGVPKYCFNEAVINKSNKTTVMLCDLNWLDQGPLGY